MAFESVFIIAATAALAYLAARGRKRTVSGGPASTVVPDTSGGGTSGGGTSGGGTSGGGTSGGGTSGGGTSGGGTGNYIGGSPSYVWPFKSGVWPEPGYVFATLQSLGYQVDSLAPNWSSWASDYRKAGVRSFQEDFNYVRPYLQSLKWSVNIPALTKDGLIGDNTAKAIHAAAFDVQDKLKMKWQDVVAEAIVWQSEKGLL